MSGFTENRASEASERSGSPGRMLTWHASRAMLPLVGRIVEDIVQYHNHLSRLRPELEALDRNRREWAWPQRARRYQLEEEIVAVDGKLRAAIVELEALGLAVLDPTDGLVGFPTLVNERRAFFS